MKLKKTLLFTIITVIILGGFGCLFFKAVRPGAPGSSSAEAISQLLKSRSSGCRSGRSLSAWLPSGISCFRGVAGEIRKHGGDPGHLCKNERYLKSGDIVFGNLENPVTPGQEIMLPERVLRADPGVAAALREAGFTILSWPAITYLISEPGAFWTLFNIWSRRVLGMPGPEKWKGRPMPHVIPVRGSSWPSWPLRPSWRLETAWLGPVIRVAGFDQEKYRPPCRPGKSRYCGGVHACRYGIRACAGTCPNPLCPHGGGCRADLVLGHHPTCYKEWRSIKESSSLQPGQFRL